LTDFLEVLRKKHAFDAASVSVGMIWSVGIFVMESTSSDPIPGAGRRPILNNDLTGCGNLTEMTTGAAACVAPLMRDSSRLLGIFLTWPHERLRGAMHIGISRNESSAIATP
jgi:hypothetical protein